MPRCCQNSKRCLDPTCKSSQLPSQRQSYPGRVAASTRVNSRFTDCAVSNTACKISSHGSFAYHSPRQFTHDGCHTAHFSMTGPGQHQPLNSPALHFYHSVMNTNTGCMDNRQNHASIMAPQFRRLEWEHHPASHPAIEHPPREIFQSSVNISSLSPLPQGQSLVNQHPIGPVQDHDPFSGQHRLPEYLSLSQDQPSYATAPSTGYPVIGPAPLQAFGHEQHQIQCFPRQQATRAASSSNSLNILTPGLSENTSNDSIETPPSSFDAAESWGQGLQLQHSSNQDVQRYKAILPLPVSVSQGQLSDNTLPTLSFGLKQSDWQDHFDDPFASMVQQPDAAPTMDSMSTSMQQAAQSHLGRPDALFDELFDFNAFDSLGEMPSAYPPPDAGDHFSLQLDSSFNNTPFDTSALPDPLLPTMPTMPPTHLDVPQFPPSFDLNDPYTTPTYAFPNTPLPPPPTNGEGTRRDTTRDSELLMLRQSGLSYRQIKKDHGFKEAESTLRGRFRTLTKPKGSRVRKPGWGAETVSIYHPVSTTQGALCCLASLTSTG